MSVHFALTSLMLGLFPLFSRNFVYVSIVRPVKSHAFRVRLTHLGPK